MSSRRTRIALAAALCTLLATGAVAGPPAAAAEGPVVSMGDQSGLERDAVFGSVFVPVTLSEAATAPVVVSYYTVNDSAVYIPPEDRVDPLVFGDYQRRGLPELPRTVTIPAGALQSQINVLVNVDDEVEADESFSVVIDSVSGADATIGDDTGVATIVDADGVSAVNPAVTVSSPSLYEGDSGDRRAQFQIHLSRPPATPIIITYTSADGSATAGSDYTAKLPGSVQFIPGQISKTVDVRVASDGAVNGDRDFTLDVAVTGGSPVEELTMSATATVLDDDQAQPLPVTPTVVGGNNHTCALDSAGVLRCWGWNGLGALGTGTTVDSLTPVSPIGLPSDVVSVEAGNAHTCILTSAGAVQCWGDNANGQVGDGTTTQRNTPTPVVGLDSGVTEIELGDNHTCASLEAGGVTCWGWGSFGQLGHGILGSSSTPVDVVGLPVGASATQLGAGLTHTCAVLDDGSARCWGRNSFGQLGTGGTETRVLSAVTPVGLTQDVTAVAGGGPHTCFVQAGGVLCTGANTAGQVGGTTALARTVPTAVAGLSNIVEVSAGGGFSCALDDAGSLSCWGLNQDGELGIGDATVNNVTTPVAVVGLTGTEFSVSSGVAHACAMAADESVRCWGINVFGQLGDGTTARRFTPVAVAGL